MTNLKTFKLITGTKFSENVVKKPHFSLAIVNKLQEFLCLEKLEPTLNLQALIKQGIEFLTNVKYPEGLNCLKLDFLLPCFDTLIQKASKSLSLVTYLSVENQLPFKEFLKAHEVFQKVRKFSLKIKSKQMQASHSKLIRAITGDLKSLESV